jgi:hypothetical protein
VHARWTTCCRRGLIEQNDGSKVPDWQPFELLVERAVPMKGLGEVTVREIHNTGIWFPTYSAENRVTDGLYQLHANNRYWPRWELPKANAGEFSHVRPLEPLPGNCDGAQRS